MNDAIGPLYDDRVLILAPTDRDADVCQTILAGAKMAALACRSVACLCREIMAGAGAAILTEESVAGDREGCLAAVVRDQPPWSDFPLVVLTAGGADSSVAAVALETLGNVTLLDRPVRVGTLISAVRAALRSRRKQYEVRDLLIERTGTAEALAAADRRKDEFLAMLAHEMRNPLAPVRNALEIMRLAGATHGQLGKSRDMIERQIDHLVRLVDDLLDVTRIARGKVELRLQRIDLVSIADQAVDAVRPALEGRTHQLEVDLPTGPLMIIADPDRLIQVLTNLLTNAGKYTPRGGHVRLSLETVGNEAVLRVRDNGIGLRSEAIPQLFDLFVQADRVPGRVAEGLGLGLALVKSLTELHGGRVSAASDGPDQGSEFVVRLPLFQPAFSEGH